MNMWALQIENLPKKSWQTKQHVPPCLEESLKKDRKEAMRQQMLKTSKKMAEANFNDSLIKLKEATIGMHSWKSADIKLWSTSATRAKHRRLEKAGYLVMEKVTSPCLAFVWRWLK